MIDLARAEAALREHGTIAGAARAMGCNRRTLARYIYQHPALYAALVEGMRTKDQRRAADRAKRLAERAAETARRRAERMAAAIAERDRRARYRQPLLPGVSHEP